VCMYACFVCVCVRVCVFVCCVCENTQPCQCVCMCVLCVCVCVLNVRTRSFTSVCACVFCVCVFACCVHVHVYAHYVRVCMRVCMSVCVCVCVCGSSPTPPLTWYALTLRSACKLCLYFTALLNHIDLSSMYAGKSKASNHKYAYTNTYAHIRWLGRIICVHSTAGRRFFKYASIWDI